MKIYLLFVLFFFCFADAFELQKPKRYSGQDVSGWVMSEKLDGIRGCWDGKNLTTKQGYKIHTPDYFTKNFPPFALDGELWIKRGAYELLQSVVLDDTPSKMWQQVRYNIFEVPEAEGNFSQRVLVAGEWFRRHPTKYVKIIEQKVCHNKRELLSFLASVVRKGGEGVIVKDPKLSYFSGRSSAVLKLKEFSDAEAEVLEIHPGKGKNRGMMGSLTVRMKDGTTFKLGTGFTAYDRKHPPKIGDIVTFRYTGWTKNRKPRFASFMRIRDKKTIGYE